MALLNNNIDLSFKIHYDMLGKPADPALVTIKNVNEHWEFDVPLAVLRSMCLSLKEAIKHRGFMGFDIEDADNHEVKFMKSDYRKFSQFIKTFTRMAKKQGLE